MTTTNRMYGRKFASLVEQATEEARAKFQVGPNHLDRDLPDKTLWVSVLMEEVGKLARCCNKLSLLTEDYDPDSRHSWDTEGQHRLVTIASMCRRMHERWPELPDHHSRSDAR